MEFELTKIRTYEKLDEGEIILDNNILKYKETNNILCDKRIRRFPVFDFIRYPAPYFDTKINIVKVNNSCSINVKIMIKDVPNIIAYLNHDIFLRDNIFHIKRSLYDSNILKLYNNILTPIYKNRLNIKPLKIDLYEYQLNSIERMLKINTFSIPLTEKKYLLHNEEGPSNKYVYYDIFNNNFIKNSPEIFIKTDGKILADEMGLGKTITTLAYLKSSPPQMVFEKKYNAKGSLIVVPSHLSKQWYNEIVKVDVDARVKLLTTKRDHLNITTREILEYDYVIVSQQFLVNKSYYMKYPNYNTTPGMFRIKNKLKNFYDNSNNLLPDILMNKPPLLELINWNTVVLDEGHEIMRLNYGNSPALSDCLINTIFSLNGNKYLYVSGTPYNNYTSYKNIIKFLRIKIEDSGEFVPINNNKYENLIFSRKFIENIMIRHTKKQVDDQINLKGLEETVYWLTQTETERQIYDGSRYRNRSYLLKLCCHLMVADISSAIKVQTIDIMDVKNNIIKQSSEKISKYEKLLLKLDPLNQSYHMLKKNYSNIISQAKFMLETINKLSNEDEEEDNECPICIDEIEEPTILPCGHLFCYTCVKEMTSIKKECPLCKQKITDDLIKVSDKSITKKDSDKKDDLIEKYGVKTGTLIRLVRKLIMKTDNNIIIFSQYDFMLKLISDSLSTNGVSNSFVSGNVYKRNKAIESFRGLRMGESSQVIMLSLKNAASGTHLVEANHIIFVEPIDSYREDVLDIENQAIARAFRIGQKKKVHIHRLLIKNTIEEEIYNNIYL